MNEGGYRAPAERPTRTLELRTVVRQPHWWLFLPVFAILSLVPLVFVPSGVDITCTAATQICQIEVQRGFGLAQDHITLNLQDATDVRYVGRGKTESLQIVSPQKTLQSRTNYGGAHALVLDTLKRFLGARTVDLTASHGLDWRPFAALFGGLSFFAVVYLSAVARIRFVASNDDVQMHIRIRRWPWKTRSFVYESDFLVGARARHMTKVGSRGATERSSTIELLTREGSEDLFPQSLPDAAVVDEMARKLDLFVRFGQTET